MRQRITAAAGALALALMLLVNFRGPRDLALATAASPGADPATAAGGTSSRTGVGNGSGATAGSTGSTTSGGTAGPTGTAGSTGKTGSSGSSGSAGSSGTGQSTTGVSVQYVGPVAADPYGNVQVEVTVKAGKIVDVTALAMPVGGRSGSISNYVAPILRKQALTVQSARIDGVSGATYTSIAYATSLQGALDQAGL
ncbi:MAG: FMN-binding protein [Chloroflexi bacterium]|nr:FMN-binding protein [Chloroflexota bacterium]